MVKKTKKSFVEKQKQKKKIKVQKQLELIEEDDWWDTLIHFITINPLTFVIVFSLVGYWGYIKAHDYLEDRKIAIEAMKEVDNLKERTREMGEKVDEFRDALENARIENAKLRQKIENLSPKEKEAVIEDQISKLKEKMDIVEKKGFKDKFNKIYEVTTHE